MLKTARNLGILGILLALTGCSMATLQASVEKWGKVAEDARKGLAVINDGLERVDGAITKVDETVGTIKAEMAKADTNNDGKVDAEEAMTWLKGLAGAGGVGSLALLFRNKKSKEEKDVIKKATEDKLAAQQVLLDDLNRRLPPAA